MSEEIKNIKLSFTCSENWDAMPEAYDRRYCDKCQTKVHDFSNSKADDFRKILAENKYMICGRFNITQTAPAPTAYPFWKRWVSAALVVLGFNLWANKANAQITKQLHTQQKTKPHPRNTNVNSPIAGQAKPLSSTSSSNNIQSSRAKSTIPDSTNYFFGMVSEVQPEFPGGNEKLNTFILKNIDQTKATKSGRINVTFIVEKDGTLSNVRAIGRIFDQNAAEEAIRVIKLSPKWIPGKQDSKTVRVQYVVPIVFK